MLALKTLSNSVCVPRQATTVSSNNSTQNLPSKLKNEIVRRVKPKKYHEIQKMTEICKNNFHESSISLAIDFGSGLGHLARFLSLYCNVDVCCVEQQPKFVEEAKRLDHSIREKYKKVVGTEVKQDINHVTFRLKSPEDFDLILRGIKDKNRNEVLSFGLVGLHPCGDLAVLLLNSFLENNSIRCINIASCCYMKLTTATTVDNQPRPLSQRTSEVLSTETINSYSYPLSRYVQNHSNHELSYQMLEVACHANEKYASRLQKADYSFLKVHSYRAALEAIIVKHRPDLKHYGLRSVQHTNDLTFKEYCRKATEGSARLKFTVPEEDVECETTQEMLKQWKRVVIFYILRLVLAPFVESIILYDRVLYLREHGCEARLIPAFDPIISPRCHILQAVKRKR